MDISYLLFLQKIRLFFGGTFDQLMLWITSLGGATVTYVLLAAIYWCVNKRAGQFMSLNISISCVFSQFIKAFCKIPRPWVKDTRIIPVEAAVPGASGYSFPSGHTARTIASWGSLGYFCHQIKNKAFSIICCVVVLLVAFSRNYLGVHTPQDVLASLIFGSLIIFLLDKILQWTDKKKNRDVIVCIVGCILCFVPMLKVGCLSNSGASFGFLIGWVLERHFVNFEIKGSLTKKVLRFLCGSVILLCLVSILPKIIGLIIPSKYIGFFTAFIISFFIIFVYPWFIHQAEKSSKKVFIFATSIVLFVILVLGIMAIVVKVKKTNTNQENITIIHEEANQADSTIKVFHNEFDENRTLKIIAHRGYSDVFPENTLSSFMGAIDINADMIELDVQLSKDGVVMVCHDVALARVAGVSGNVSDYTYDELKKLDVGSWFSSEYKNERIPTLAEVLDLVKDYRQEVYLELKDIGDVEGFEKAVLDVTDSYNMTSRCIFASFNYSYLKQLKSINNKIRILYNTISGKESLPNEFPAEYYGLYSETITSTVVNTIHNSGSYAFVWTVNKPEQMRQSLSLGVDGIVTNCPGLAKIITIDDYKYLADNYEDSFEVPGLYGKSFPDGIEKMIVQGFTKVGNQFIVSAYCQSGEDNSILYLLNNNGKLNRVINLGFKAHVGGIAYDENSNLLWSTGPNGLVYALPWQSVLNGSYNAEELISFDAELTNHNNSKVASFLTVYGNKLYVGSYTDGINGKLRIYDITDFENIKYLSEIEIPERIQGITFCKKDGQTQMILSQGFQTEDSKLLWYSYDEENQIIKDFINSEVIPEGSEQILATVNGLYILFESAVRPYRPTARIVNDQIYLLRN